MKYFHNDRLTVERARAIFDYCPISGMVWWKFRPEMRNAWNSRYAGKPAGTLKKGYVQVCVKIDGTKHFFSGQRLIWALFYGEWPQSDVDHEDHDTTNNSILNLREANPSQNSANKRELRGATPYKGVYFMRARGRFAAQIKADNRHHWLGLHDTAEGAALAYDRAAIALHGCFAKTNAQMGLL